MEFEENFILNCTSLILTIFGITIAIIVIISRLRLRWPIKVNCWFCNNNTRIWRSESDWWRCPSCEQYNGFSEDGDYNYDIVEQRYKSLNDSSIYATAYKSGSEYSTSSTSLCNNCNCKEEMKVLQMSLIDPNELSAEEIECYRESLEKQYPLCSRCNSLVRHILEKQTLWLTQYKMMLFKQRPIEILVNNTNILMKVSKIFLTILSATIIYEPTLQALPIIGASLQLLVLTMNVKQKYITHLLLTALWLCQWILLPYYDQQLLEHFKFINYKVSHITGYQIIIILSTILGFINLTIFNKLSSTVTTANNLSFKKLSSRKTLMDSSVEKEMDIYLNEESSGCKKKLSSINVTHLLTSSSFCSYDESSQLRDDCAPPLSFKICPSQMNLAPVSLDDSLRTLSSLSLSETNPTISSKNPKIFETKTYGMASPNLDLFKKNFSTATCKKKFVLSPPKLKPEITQNSWVAGGYWQMGMDRPTLSRSSSQSSGFGSTGSNFPPSREASVANDVDRSSIMSDATLCYQQTSSSIGHDNSFCHNRHLNDHNYIKSIAHKTCPNNQHSTTIFSSSAWISALLCGSLIFNVIIFCTILYR